MQPPEGPPSCTALKRLPSLMPPPMSKITWRSVEPMGTSARPPLMSLPARLKALVPRQPSTPRTAYAAAPLAMIQGMSAKVSTLLMLVGLPQRPETAGNGGRVRGMPRTRPPFPAVSGLWGKPTNINIVANFANIPWLIANGAAAYAVLGVEGCRGTKAFSLAGKLINGGLAEVPMGSTLRHVIFDIGGGIKDGKRFKAVQLGGPSGGCIPASLLDTPVDYESLAATGAIVGSGGMVVVDDETCMVDLARFFLDFTQKESCGKCTPCRLGTKRMLEILERITRGEGK